MIHKFVPSIAKGLFGMLGTDNCPDAKKERRETGKKYIAHLREQNLHEETRQNGVEKRLKNLGDGFHVDQLGNKKMSEGACGKTDGEFTQNHHRQVSTSLIKTVQVESKHNSPCSFTYHFSKMMQCIWNIKVRNQELFKRISNEILASVDVDSSAKDSRPAPGNETDAQDWPCSIS